MKQVLLNIRQAAEALAVSERTIFNLTKSGDLPSVRIGRSVRYRMKDLEHFGDSGSDSNASNSSK